MSDAEAASGDGEVIIRCAEVGKRFGARWVLRDVTLDIRRDEILGVFGPGGHGKSVLLKLLAGLLRPDAGRVVARGEDLAKLDADGLAKVRERYGYLFQNYALFDFMTVRDNVAFPLRQSREEIAEEEIARRVEARIEEVGLSHAIDRLPSELSGGMKKRVGLARATVGEPLIALYDDPSAGLDPVTSSKIFRLIDKMHAHQEGTASVVVSHDIDRMREICDRYIMVHDGRVIFDGPESAIADAEQDVVRDFFEGAVNKHAGAR